MNSVALGSLWEGSYVDVLCGGGLLDMFFEGGAVMYISLREGSSTHAFSCGRCSLTTVPSGTSFSTCQYIVSSAQ